MFSQPHKVTFWPRELFNSSKVAPGSLQDGCEIISTTFKATFEKSAISGAGYRCRRRNVHAMSTLTSKLNVFPWEFWHAVKNTFFLIQFSESYQKDSFQYWRKVIVKRFSPNDPRFRQTRLLFFQRQRFGPYQRCLYLSLIRTFDMSKDGHRTID